MNSKKLAELTQYIEAADLALQQAREVLVEIGGDKASIKINKSKAKDVGQVIQEGAKKIIEGVFDGQNMIDKDEKEYSVPANYASKSKLVEGDVLKLTIDEDGSYLYKQIKPIERKRITGELVMDEVSGQYSVLGSDGKKYNVLSASVTYFKGENGDKVTILVPKDKVAQWAVIENVISETEEQRNKETEKQEVVIQKNEVKKPEPFKLKIKSLDDEVKEIMEDIPAKQELKKSEDIASQEKQKIENVIEAGGNLGELDNQDI